ncbi:MAG TPA: hypothetical protein VK086_06840 [Ruania sp.]|nr:hypothetical protein [Ruania sp.]
MFDRRAAGVQADIERQVGYFGAAVLVLSPFFPSTAASQEAGSSKRELRKAGASRGIARVLGWGGGLVALVLFCIALMGPAFVLIDP